MNKSARHGFARLSAALPVAWLRRVLPRTRRAMIGHRWVTVRPSGPDTVQVRRLRGFGWWSYQLADPGARHKVRDGRLQLVFPDASALVQLAVSGLLTGQIRGLRVRLATAPGPLVWGIRPPRVGRTTQGFRWHRRGNTLTVEFSWLRPYPIHDALADALAAVLRSRQWDQVSGPVFALDRSAWLAAVASWPQGRLTAARPAVEADLRGRPLGPYLIPGSGTSGQLASVVTAVANPFGRKLVNTAARYQLQLEPGGVALRDEVGRVALRMSRDRGAGAAVAGSSVVKYAVVSVGSPPPADPFVAEALRSLAACGMVFATTDAAAREALNALGLVTIRSAKEVADLAGYALSVGASRQMAVSADAALRRTALGGEGHLPLPTVSVVLSSVRAEHIETSLRYLAEQTYPALEVVVGLHGYHVSEEAKQRWRALLPFPIRVTEFPPEVAFGAVLGRLSQIADGELITKLDDDDHYGPNHVTDLMIAWHTSGADMVAKGARFVHFPDLHHTIDRVLAAPEAFNVYVAGGTILVSRSTLQQVGGWSHSSKHVDQDLQIRVRSSGGVVYRTHGLEYVYVRRTDGHTFESGIDQIAEQGTRVYQGLPPEIVRPEYPVA